MKTKVITLKELTEDNPTLCMSADRIFEQCYRCPIFRQKADALARKGISKNDLVSETVRQLPCTPKLNKKAWAVIKLRALKNTINQLAQEIIDILEDEIQ